MINKSRRLITIYVQLILIIIVSLSISCGQNSEASNKVKAVENVENSNNNTSNSYTKNAVKEITKTVKNNTSKNKNNGKFAPAINEQNGFDIKIKFKNLKNSEIYLAHHFGTKQFIKDTALVDHNGFAHFKKEDYVTGGLYLMVLPSKNYFELILNEPKFEIEVDTTDMLNLVKFKNSPENEVFFTDLKFIAEVRKEAEKLSKEKQTLTKAGKDIKNIDGALNAIGKRVKNYRTGLMKQYPNYFYTKLLQASEEVVVPDPPKNADGTIDSTFQYKFYKKHYLDGIDFSDSRLLNTPILHNKFEYYISKLTLQVPDSIVKETKWIVDTKVNNNQDVFKYVVNHITSTYEKSKIVGMDAVFVKMVDLYYRTGQAYWIDSDTQLYKIKDRAKRLKPLLINKTAPNMILKDKNEKFVDMHKLDYDITILFFWDPDCGHCKKSIPALKAFWDKYKHESVMIYAAGTEVEKDKWLKFIKEKELDWINVGDFDLRNHFREIYDISSTPVIYLLDKDKKIKVKKIGVEQLEKVYEDMRDGKIK